MNPGSPHTQKSRCGSPCRFSLDELSLSLATACSWLDFAFILGSARAGTVPPGSDVDVAVHFRPGEAPTLERLGVIMDTIAAVCHGCEADIGVLNRAGVVYRFESLRGRRLFVRPEALERVAGLYTLT